MDVFLSSVLPIIFNKLTGTEILIFSVIMTAFYSGFLIFKKNLPFIITTRKTVDFIKTSTRNTDKDIIDINNVYAVQLSGIIVSGLADVTRDLSKFINNQVIMKSSDQVIIKKKSKALSISLKLITFESKDCIRQLTRENGFIDHSVEELKQYALSKEFLLYDIIKNVFESDYIYNEDDNLYSVISGNIIESLELKKAISESYFNIFKNIQTHLLRCKDKTNELMDNNEKIIKEFI